jgi:hypothetical protein
MSVCPMIFRGATCWRKLIALNASGVLCSRHRRAESRPEKALGGRGDA